MPLIRFVLIRTLVIIRWSGLSLCVLIYGCFDWLPLKEQILSFYIPSQFRVIFYGSKKFKIIDRLLYKNMNEK